MKAKDKDTKRSASVAELQEELRATREKHFRLRFKHKAMPVANPMEIQHLRRHIARLETWLREKQLTGKQ
ncbi:MAG: 50S ribosomal protein L29 [Elusimicrobia bacterium]|nr:50S ribosomal protein L29 [Elusimicrobiota bacterium]